MFISQSISTGCDQMCAQRGYYHYNCDGTAPFCDGSCSSGWTSVGHCSSGSSCSTGHKECCCQNSGETCDNFNCCIATAVSLSSTSTPALGYMQASSEMLNNNQTQIFQCNFAPNQITALKDSNQLLFNYTYPCNSVISYQIELFADDLSTHLIKNGQFKVVVDTCIGDSNGSPTLCNSNENAIEQNMASMASAGTCYFLPRVYATSTSTAGNAYRWVASVIVSSGDSSCTSHGQSSLSSTADDNSEFNSCTTSMNSCTSLEDCTSQICDLSNLELVECGCNDQWSGEDCSIPVCNPPCDSEGGYCTYNDLENENICTCNANWSGETCNIATCINGCINGNCTNPNTCVCDDYWQGENCDVPLCDPQCVQGTCLDDNVCICDDGWIGPRCNDPAPFILNLLNEFRCAMINNDQGVVINTFTLQFGTYDNFTNFWEEYPGSAYTQTAYNQLDTTYQHILNNSFLPLQPTSGSNYIISEEWYIILSDIIIPYMSALESAISLQSEYSANSNNAALQLNITNSAINEVDEELNYYSLLIQQTQQLRIQTQQSINILQQQMNSLSLSINQTIETTEEMLNSTLTNLNNSLQQDINHCNSQKTWDIVMDSLNTATSAASAMISFAGDDAASGISSTMDTINNINSLVSDSTSSCSCSKYYELCDQIEETEEDQVLLNGLVQDITALEEMYDIIFSNTTEISSNTAIQTLTLATLDINQLNAYLNTYSQELVAAGSDEAEVVDDAYEMSSLMLQMLQLIQTSYQLAQQQQYYQMEYDTYYSQQQQLIYEMQQDNNQYQIDQLSNLLLDSKILYLQVLLSKYITEEYRQYNFWAAKDLDIPVIQSSYYSESFCEAASVAELEASQCKLCNSVQDQLNQYDPNQIDEKMTCSWTEYVITQEQYPDLFEQLQSTGSATFPVLLPESTVFWDVVTYYVYVYPNLVYNKITQSNTISDDIRINPNLNDDTIQMFITKEGQSAVISENCTYPTPTNSCAQIYTHEPSTFIVSYNPTTLAPASQEITLPSFVSYSPHGYWTVDIPSGNNLNISLIDNLTFYFFISYQEATSENVVTPLFGNGMGWPAVVAPPSQYISGNCIDWVSISSDSDDIYADCSSLCVSSVIDTTEEEEYATTTTESTQCNDHSIHHHDNKLKTGNENDTQQYKESLSIMSLILLCCSIALVGVISIAIVYTQRRNPTIAIYEIGSSLSRHHSITEFV